MWHHLLIYCYLFVKDVHYSWLDWSRHSMTAEIIESDTHRRMSWLSLTLVDRWVNRHGHSSRAELIHSDTHCRRPSWLMRYSSSTFEWINTATHHSVKSGLMQIPVYNWINWSRITRLARSRYSITSLDWTYTDTHRSVLGGLMQMPINNWINWSRISWNPEIHQLVSGTKWPTCRQRCLESNPKPPTLCLPTLRTAIQLTKPPKSS